LAGKKKALVEGIATIADSMTNIARVVTDFSKAKNIEVERLVMVSAIASPSSPKPCPSSEKEQGKTIAVANPQTNLRHVCERH
jgi:hypothetical protein